MSKSVDTYPILSTIESPADLRKLSAAQLPALAAELRQFLIHSVSTRGGHFAAGLGTVELTIALHYVFNTPDDQLVWDVGHQAYPHKVLECPTPKVSYGLSERVGKGARPLCCLMVCRRSPRPVSTLCG